MVDWVRDHPGVVWTVAGASAAVFVLSLLSLPPLVARIQDDYFNHKRRPRSRLHDEHPIVQVTLRTLKNLLGVVLMLAGVAMLVLPGQGLITLFIGFVLVDFPGKYRLEKWIVRRSLIRRPINWLRKRAGRGPLVLTLGPESDKNR